MKFQKIILSHCGLVVKGLSLFIIFSKCGQEYENIFKEEESIEILKVLRLFNNTEEYQKIYNHA